MFDFKDIIHIYEGKGIPYRGRCDDIKNMVVNFCSNDFFLNKKLASLYCNYNFIDFIDVHDDSFYISYDDGCIFFRSMSKQFFSDFCNHIFDDYVLRRQCHNSTLMFLKNFPTANFKAVTSLCVSNRNILFFHSYIYDSAANLVYDFSRNIIMNKDMYDMLFCYDQINCLSYDEYVSYLESCGNNNSNYCDLLYLACVSLSKSISYDIKRKKIF